MTNSTDTKGSTGKGPFRWEAVVPAGILIGLLAAYFHFFFDRHLKRSLEFIGTQVHGAEVNIANIQTSFWRASLSVAEIEVTDKESPQRNIVAISQLNFSMSWDALLRAKILIEEASILGIRPLSPRAQAGFVLPPQAPSNSYWNLMQEQLLAQTRKRFNENFLGDLAKVLSGVDPKDQLKEIQGQLKSTETAEKLKVELRQKKTDWETRIAELPRPKELEPLRAELKALNLKTKNPMEIASNLKKAKEILQAVEEKIATVDGAQSDLQKDLQRFSQEVSDLPKLAQQDARDLQKRLQLPSIDPKELALQLFLPQLEKYLVSARKYGAIARKVLPPKRTKEEKLARGSESLVPRERGEGQTFHFPVTTGYPLFWLKRAAISSEMAQGEWAGKAKGELTGLSSHPEISGQPFRLALNGSFPKQELEGLEIVAVVDRAQEEPSESLSLSLASAPLSPWTLSAGDSTRLILQSGKVSGSGKLALKGDGVEFRLATEIRDPNFTTEVSSQQLREILSGALKDVPKMTLSAKVVGPWSDLAIDMDSNLGTVLSAAFQKQLQGKLTEAKKQLDSLVEAKLGPVREQLNGELKLFKNGPANSLEKEREQMNALLQEAKAAALPGAGGGAGGFLRGLGL
jgi:uncharacterized protein (TIGR03545 family)